MSLRIIAGMWKGRCIEVPRGSATRPTSERVRESLMSSLISILGDFSGLHVLDAFAGSGALGLEAMSRGAESVWFYEKNRRAFSALVTNCARCERDYSSTMRLYQDDVFIRLPKQGKVSFDLVFLDPPYATKPEKIFAFLKKLFEINAIHGGTIATYEHDTALHLSVILNDESSIWDRVAQKRYGGSSIDILSCNV